MQNYNNILNATTFHIKNFVFFSLRMLIIAADMLQINPSSKKTI